MFLILSGVDEWGEGQKNSDITKKKENLIQNVVSEDVVSYIAFSFGNHQRVALNLDNVFRLEDIERTQIQFSGEIPIVDYRKRVMSLLVPNDFSVDEKDHFEVIVFLENDKYFGIVCEKIYGIETSSVFEKTFFDNTYFSGLATIKNNFYNVLDLDIFLNVFEKKKKQVFASSQELRDIDHKKAA